MLRVVFPLLCEARDLAVPVGTQASTGTRRRCPALGIVDSVSYIVVRQFSAHVSMLATSLRTTNLPANLKLAILIHSVALAISVLTMARELLLFVVILVAFQAFCGYLSNYRFVIACYLVAVPNIIIAAIYVLYIGLAAYFGDIQHWTVYAAMVLFSSLAFVALLLARMAKRRLRDHEETPGEGSAVS